ncbi:hypothetical protein ATCC90586_006189 [Pythium insidiosum]|nr:hypothetical protein ATCC90586_006189 [Pythium insidiosum]
MPTSSMADQPHAVTATAAREAADVDTTPRASSLQQDTRSAPSSVAVGLLLGAICVLSVAIRLFPAVKWGSVIHDVAIRLFPAVKWGSVIHEYDPHFNYRVAKVLSAHGAEELRDWFDDRAWYPLGRAVGPTLYPGLMVAAVAIQRIAESVFLVPLNVRDACVFVAPIFAAFASLALYALTKEATGKATTALVAAALLALSPAYISRSTAGSFDNEGVAIFLLIATFWLWIRAVRSGSMFTAGAAALVYFAMVVSWGGYVLIINLIPLHVLAVVAAGQYSSRLYIAYSTFYPLATLLAMQVPFVGFNIVLKAETAGSHAVFLGLQAFAFVRFLQEELPIEQFRRLLVAALSAAAALAAVAVVTAMLLGKLQWSGRSLTLLDPSYAAKHIPIIASVGEHQPPPWSAFYLSLGPLLILAPLGMFVCFQRFDEAHVFMVVYSVFSFYFAGIMVRLLLTLAPAACFLSAVGVSELLEKVSIMTRLTLQPEAAAPSSSSAESAEAEPSPASGPATTPTRSTHKSRKRHDASAASTNASAAALALAAQRRAELQQQVKDSFWGDVKTHVLQVLRFSPAKEDRSKLPDALGLFLVAVLLLLIVHARHCASVAHKAYSSTSMEIESWNRETGPVVHDDLREAYFWLRMNTPDDAKILSWWDYGYQISALSNRTVLVDNNTWNNTHIATVGRVLVSDEDAAWPILQSLEVDYVLVLFGGRVEHSNLGDDVDKMAWIIRIAQGVFPDAVLESEFKVNNQYVFETSNATSAMTSSLLYKMCYHQFLSDATANDTTVDNDASYAGINDPKRSTNIDARGISFKHLEEAFTSESWFVRIYRSARGGSREACTMALASVLRPLLSTPSSLAAALFLSASQLAPPHNGIELGMSAKRFAPVLRRLVTDNGADDVDVPWSTLLPSLPDYSAAIPWLESRGHLNFRLDSATNDGDYRDALTIADAHAELLAIAKEEGIGSQLRKQDRALALLRRCRTTDELVYLVRLLAHQKLRIAMGDKSILTALAAACLPEHSEELASSASPARRQWVAAVTQAYSQLPDYGALAAILSQIVAEESGQHNGDDSSRIEKMIKRLMHDAAPVVGTPVLPMAAYPLSSVREALDRLRRLGAGATCEHKYDGARVQLHWRRDGTGRVFSRNLEDQTARYGSLLDTIAVQVSPDVRELVVEGEVVALDRVSGSFLPFQVLQQVSPDASTPTAELGLYMFDLLTLNSENWMNRSLFDRRMALSQALRPRSGHLELVTSIDLCFETDSERAQEDKMMAALRHARERARLRG